MKWLSNLFSFFRKKKQEPAPVPTAPAPVAVIPAPSAPAVSASPSVGPSTAPSVASDPGAPFGRNNYGMPFATQADADAYKKALAEHDANQKQIDQMTSVERYHGPISVNDITDAEMDFLYYANVNYQGCFGVPFAVLSGSLDEINLKINQASGRVKAGDVPQGTDRVKGYVDAFSKGLLKTNVTH